MVLEVSCTTWVLNKDIPEEITFVKKKQCTNTGTLEKQLNNGKMV